MHTSELIAQLREECDEDYVGVWEILSVLRRNGLGNDGVTEEIASVTAALLASPDITIGQFTDGVFHEWPGDTGSRLKRLESELRQIGHEPDIGDVAWLTKR